jgi:hypothetical protein
MVREVPNSRQKAHGLDNFIQAGLPLLKRRLSVSLNVRSSFMSKSRESLATPPGLVGTGNDGIGGSGLITQG